MKKLSDMLGGVVPDVEKMVAAQTEPFLERLDTIISELREIKVYLRHMAESRDEAPASSADERSERPSRLYPELEPNDP